MIPNDTAVLYTYCHVIKKNEQLLTIEKYRYFYHFN